jgi:hypothetical protein
MAIDDGRPDFRFKCQGPTTAPETYYGMTLRDYFAAKALAWWGETHHRLATNICSSYDEQEMAKVAYRIADAMLAQRRDGAK